MKDKKDLIEYAKTLGIKLTVDPSLNKYSGKPLFPEKLEAVNKLVANMKIRQS